MGKHGVRMAEAAVSRPQDMVKPDKLRNNSKALRQDCKVRSCIPEPQAAGRATALFLQQPHRCEVPSYTSHCLTLKQGFGRICKHTVLTFLARPKTPREHNP